MDYHYDNPDRAAEVISGYSCATRKLLKLVHEYRAASLGQRTRSADESDAELAQTEEELWKLTGGGIEDVTEV